MIRRIHYKRIKKAEILLPRWSAYVVAKKIFLCLGKVRFFFGGGGLGNFLVFFPKTMLALPCVLIKKKTPDPPPLGD